MFDFLYNLEISILAQAIIFVVLITVYYLLQRKLPTYHFFGIASLHTVALILIFILILVTWSSEVNPNLRTIYVLVMSIVNIYLVVHVIQSIKALSLAKSELKGSGQDSKNQSRK